MFTSRFTIVIPELSILNYNLQQNAQFLDLQNPLTETLHHPLHSQIPCFVHYCTELTHSHTPSHTHTHTRTEREKQVHAVIYSNMFDVKTFGNVQLCRNHSKVDGWFLPVQHLSISILYQQFHLERGMYSTRKPYSQCVAILLVKAYLGKCFNCANKVLQCIKFYSVQLSLSNITFMNLQLYSLP